MLDDFDLKNLCVLAEKESEFVDAIGIFKNKPYLDYDKREIILQKVLNDATNAKKIVKIIYG